MKQRKLPIPKQGTKGMSYSGRISISDATPSATETDFWLSENPIVPTILASPKPTAFQEYLTQNSQEKKELKHYDSTDDTEIRGHKMYWFKGNVSIEEIKPKPDSPNVDPQTGEVNSHSSQHTLMKPIKAGKEFHFKVNFENLSKLELGALWWVLEISGQQNFIYAHHLGMGKPIGMGAVKLKPTLNITQKNKRYKSLLNDSKWADGKVDDVKQVSDAIRIFEEYIFSAVDKPSQCSNFHSIPRILSLLKMLEWHDPDNNKNKKQYSALPEFRNRPVLPSPFGVWTRSTASEQSASSQISSTSQNRVQGTVKWYGRGNEGSYHGYVIIDRTNEEIHINARDLQDQNFLLNKNDRVEFVIKKTGTKTYANSVKKI